MYPRIIKALGRKRTTNTRPLAMKQTPTKQEQNNNRGIQDIRYKEEIRPTYKQKPRLPRRDVTVSYNLFTFANRIIFSAIPLINNDLSTFRWNCR